MFSYALTFAHMFSLLIPSHACAHAQSAILSACFARFHPNLVLGGSYSGQIVLWDNRTKRTPVQRSAMSCMHEYIYFCARMETCSFHLVVLHAAKSHTHPVYSLQVVGTQNAHNLISVSSDGKMCAWSLDMLRDPLESYTLQSGMQLYSSLCRVDLSTLF